MPNETPSPLEGIEIPGVPPVEDYQIKHAIEYGKKHSHFTDLELRMACELAERRLADRDSIRIPKDDREELAELLEYMEAMMPHGMLDAKQWAKRLREGK